MTTRTRIFTAIIAAVLVPISTSSSVGDDKIYNALASPLDFAAKSADAVEIAKEMEESLRAQYAEVPPGFAIVMVGRDLQVEGITKNARCTDIDVKQRTLAELLTVLTKEMNPLKLIKDLSHRDQRVVWTVGKDPRGANKDSVVLITTRRAAATNGYALPAEFLAPDERDGALKLEAAALQRSPERAAEDAKAKKIEEAKLLGWSKVISASTIEDEIKSLKLAIDNDVTTPDQFAAGGYKSCRMQFTELAVLFAVIAEYDEEVRWRDDGPLARHLFNQTAQVCKIGARQSFDQTKQRQMDLSDLLRGAHIMRDGGAKLNWRADWDAVGERAPLMKRMEQALMQNVKNQVADDGAFRASRDKLVHEAEMMRLIATVLSQKGRENADDAEYVAAAKKLTAGSGDLIEAAKLNQFDRAAAAVTRIEMSCSNCHESFR